jgi:hypothetical protein
LCTVLFGILPARPYSRSCPVHSFIPLFMFFICVLSTRLPLRHVLFIPLATLCLSSHSGLYVRHPSRSRSWCLPISYPSSIPQLRSLSQYLPWIDSDPTSSLHTHVSFGSVDHLPCASFFASLDYPSSRVASCSFIVRREFPELYFQNPGVRSAYLVVRKSGSRVLLPENSSG